MTPSRIGQRTECAMPKPLLCRTSMLSIEGNKIRDALHAPLVRTTLDESERHDATTAQTHSTPPDWQDLSVFACQCVPGVPGCICAFSVHLAVSSFGDDH